MGGFTLTPPESTESGGTGRYTLTPPARKAGASNALDVPFSAEALKDTLVDTGKNLALGAVKGAANIGATILQPIDYVSDKITGKTDPKLSALVTGTKPKSTNEERRAALADFSKENADPNSTAFKAGELGTEIAGTAGAGGALAAGARAVPAIAKYAPKLASALESGGLKLGGEAATTAAGKVADVATRVAGGAVTGGVSAGLIDPSNAGTGAVIGAALPAAVKAAGAAGAAIAPKVSQEVGALYEKAKALGINIPLDRITNSKPLNAVAASLNYVPFSGRSATEEMMHAQMNRALSKTFGQDSPNVTMALRRAEQSLGDKFEFTLKGNKVTVDSPLLDDLASNMDTAIRELKPADAKIIGNKIDDLLAKVGPDGSIDGQAAYNVKKELDRIGNRTTNEAFYAREVKRSLMAALERSLGPEEAAKFATVRKQYGTMLDLQGLAKNGAEGGISVARLANMKDIKNPELQDLADIAAQFLVSRESPHGAMQRVFLAGAGVGTSAAAPATIPALVGGVALGRAANSALNFEKLKQLAVSRRPSMESLPDMTPARSLLYNSSNRGSNP